MGTRGLESLSVWQKAREFAVDIVANVLPGLPGQEKWAMSDQLRRSAQSIPSNIAEGYGRYYYQDGVRFCYIARGSLEETYSLLCLASGLNYLTTEEFDRLQGGVDELRRMLSGYIEYLKRSKRGKDEPGVHFSVRDLPPSRFSPPEDMIS